MKNTSKKYDVIILTHSPSDELTVSLKEISKQIIKPYNIIICNTEKKLFYKNIKDKYELNKVLKENKIKKIEIKLKDFDHGKTRNEAMKYTKSDFVLFMTDDAIPYDEYLTANLLSAFDDDVATVYARQIAKVNAPLKEKYVREFNYPDYDIIKNKSTEKKYGIKNCFCSNSCCMYNKKIFKKLKAFKEGLTQNEDMLYAYKAIENGYNIVYKASAKVYHSHNLSYLAQYKRNYDIGVFQKQNAEIYDRLPSEGEGLKLLKYVEFNLLKTGHPISAIDFIIECFFRYFGYKKGKKYDS